MSDATTPDAARPPLWAAAALRLFVAARDRESIAGDLLEEYRESILPRRGPAGARRWYARQVVSLMSSVRLGLALGLLLALGATVGNVVLPLAKAGAGGSDDPAPVAVVLLGLWGAAGCLAWLRTGRLAAAARAGAIVALVSMGITMLAFFVIDNVFLDLVSRQPEKIWQLQHSHFHSMRAILNAAHARAVVFVLPLLTLAGAVCGAAGGLAGRLAGGARVVRTRS
jgi:hypothetical protein